MNLYQSLHRILGITRMMSWADIKKPLQFILG